MDSPILINSQAESSCDSLDRRRLVMFRLLTFLSPKEKRKKEMEKQGAKHHRIYNLDSNLARQISFKLKCNSLSPFSYKTDCMDF